MWTKISTVKVDVDKYVKIRYFQTEKKVWNQICARVKCPNKYEISSLKIIVDGNYFWNEIIIIKIIKILLCNMYYLMDIILISEVKERCSLEEI